MRKLTGFLIAGLLMLSVCVTYAGDVVLSSFETAQEVSSWTLDGGVSASVSPVFASDGTNSLRMTVQPSPWNGISKSFDLADWKTHANLEFDVFADQPADHLCLELRFPQDSGWIYSFFARIDALAAGQRRHIVVPLTDMDQLRAASTTLIHFIYGDVHLSTTFYIDNIRLTGDSATVRNLNNLKRLVGTHEAAIIALGNSGLNVRVSALKTDIDAALAASSPIPAQYASLKAEWNSVLNTYSMSAMQARGIANPEYVVGFETSMRKVRRSDTLGDITGAIAGGELSMSLATVEYESAQLVVMPISKDLTGVRMVASDFLGPGGVVLTKDNIEIRQVGEVNIAGTTDVSTRDLTGKWPDPLMSYSVPITIKSGGLQCVWLTAYAPEGTVPGTYSGSVTITSTNSHSYTVPVTLRVRNFVLPKVSTLKTLFGFHAYPLVKFYNYAPYPDYGNTIGWPDNWDFEDVPWSVLKKWIDYAGKYRVTIGGPLGWGTYDAPPPSRLFWPLTKNSAGTIDFSSWNTIMGYAIDHGANTLSVMNNSKTAGLAHNQEYIDFVTNFLPQMQANVAAKGWTDKTYVYLTDEPPWNTLGTDLLDIAKLQKGLAPNLRTLVTTAPPTVHAAYDELTNYIDTWVPLMDGYVPTDASNLRARNKEVWWYTCLIPYKPYPHPGIYQPATDWRLIPWLSWKYKVDGYLYWGLDSWGDANIASTRIPKWPNAEWTLAGYPYPPGDGYLMYPGPSGQPWSSIRLENFRDGMEDYEYCVLLRTQLAELDRRRIDSTQARLMRIEARRLLDIDAQLARNATQYTDDPEVLENYRARIATAIEQCKVILGE